MRDFYYAKTGALPGPRKSVRHLVLNPYLQHLSALGTDNSAVTPYDVWTKDVISS